MKAKAESMPRRQRRRRARFGRNDLSGFTLIEVSVAVLLMSVLLIGTMNLFVAVTRTAASTSAAVSSSYDAANALQRIIEDAREARWMALPDEKDNQGVVMFAPRPGYASSGLYQTTLNNKTVYTAALLTFPARAADTTVKAPNGGSYSLLKASRDALYDRTTDGAKIVLYRANADGAPNPAGGTCLWAYSLSDNGASVDRAIIKSLAVRAANAVQFVRPQDASGNVLPYQLEIKIVSAYASTPGQVETSESTDGANVTQLTGRCVQMRDHERARDHNPATTPGGNAAGSMDPWQPS